MRNRINRSTINVIVDRNDLVDVAGIETLRGALPLYPRATHARATRAHATTPATAGKPGCSPGGQCELGGKRPHCLPVMGQMHQQMTSVAKSERLPQSWRSSRSVFTTSRQFAASLG